MATSEISHCPAASGEPGEQGDHSGCTAITASMLANEHSFKAQLRATAFTVLLFLATWAFGALAVSQGHYLDMIFSCLYGAFSVTLGLFLLIQHCAKRDDVWHRWWACCHSKPKVDVNGEAGNTEIKSSLEAKQPCTGKPLLSTHLLIPSPHYSPSSLPTAQIPMSPCCSTLFNTPTVLQGSIHSLSLPDELPRPSLPLQSCLKDRTKSRSFSRPRPCLKDTLHMTSTSLDESVHSSHLDSPHSMQLENSITCHTSHLESQLSCHSLHLDNQLHCTSPGIHMETNRTHLDSQSLCHGGQTCHRHMYCVKAEPFSSICCSITDTCSRASRGGDNSTDSLIHSSTKMTNKGEDIMLHLDIPPLQATVPSSQATLSRKGTLRQRGMLSHSNSLHEDYVFSPDSTGNIRTGPWKNETTV